MSFTRKANRKNTLMSNNVEFTSSLLTEELQALDELSQNS